MHPGEAELAIAPPPSTPRPATQERTPVDYEELLALVPPTYTLPPVTQDLTPGDYEELLALLEGPSGVLYVEEATEMLARTKPSTAASLLLIDPSNRLPVIVPLLKDELSLLGTMEFLMGEREGAVSVAAQCADQQAASARRPPSPPPTPTSFFCELCQTDDPMEDCFLVSGCEHAFCRDMIHQYIMERIESKDPTPSCPIDGCNTVISDVDMALVLTEDEQRQYYAMSLDVGVERAPDLHPCLDENCRGAIPLEDGNTHFVCPLCRAERCVTCNTRVWHGGETCEQLQQRVRDSELHPEQLRALFANSAYMCGSCSFGPIEHFNCYNLQTHQGEQRGSGRVNNGCPQCGWFAADLNEWRRWDGVVWSERQAAAARG